MENDKLLHLLGLCRRAGKLTIGQDSCLRTIKAGKAQLVIMSTQSSDNAKTKFTDICATKNVSIVFLGHDCKFGESIGKPSNTVVAVLDLNFKNALLNTINDVSEQNENAQTMKLRIKGEING